MRKFVGLLGLALIAVVGCAPEVEGVRVGQPSTAKPRTDLSSPNAKIIAENTIATVDEGQGQPLDGVVVASSPFPIEPLDGSASQVELDKLKGGAIQSNWVPPGQTDRWGHAQVIVNAPLAVVRTQATDFGHIKDVAPSKFKTSRVVDKKGGLTDVYLQMPMMKGLIMLWEVVRFAPVEVIAPGHEVVYGALVKGNVKQCRIVVTMRAVDPQHTVLTCDLLMTPEFYAPQATIDEELRDGAQDAVEGLKRRAEASLTR